VDLTGPVDGVSADASISLLRPEMIYMLVAVGYLVQLILFFALNLRGGYSPVTHAVSDYGVGPTKHLFNVYGLVGCAAAVLLVVALLVDGRFPMRGSIYLAIVAALRVGVLAFPTDLEGQKLTRVGKLHYLFAIASFALLYMAIDVLHPAAVTLFAQTPVTVLTALKWVVTWSLIGVVVCLAPPLRKIFGLVERIFLLSTMMWLGMFALVAAGV